ncbi:hypothetical protein ABGB16_10675 [Micromonospora sp. B11E3]|uniref:hypothetical protein n=1 Tax=Micromonospora sp. B11E3 TaxID=3153562 RepID=UPI00325E1EB0
MTDPTSHNPADEPADQPQPVDEPYTSQEAPPAGPNLESSTLSPRSTTRTWLVGGLALAVALGTGVVIGAVTAGNGDPAVSAVDGSPSATASSAAHTSAAPTTAAPTTAAPTSAAPSLTKTTPPAKPKPPSYQTLSERRWKLVAKNPDAYLGKTYVVYGRVTQFDAATGTDSFRADVAHRRMADEWDYETNTMLTGSDSDLEDLVEDDTFRAKVTVLGSYSYDTQIGGQTTVPLLQVDSITVL